MKSLLIQVKVCFVSAVRGSQKEGEIPKLRSGWKKGKEEWRGNKVWLALLLILLKDNFSAYFDHLDIRWKISYPTDPSSLHKL